MGTCLGGVVQLVLENYRVVGWLASIIFMHIVDFDSDLLVILTRNDAQQKFNCSVISLLDM